MGSHSVEQLVIEMESVRRVTITLRGDQRLKRFQCLDRSLEADRSRLDVVLGRRLSHNRADQVIREEVRPDFLPHEFGRLAAQDVHLQRLLERPQIEFTLPAIIPPLSQVLSASLAMQ